MRSRVIIWLGLIPMLLHATGINDLRHEFHQIDTKEDLIGFLHRAEEVNDSSLQPYRIAAHMRQAVYTANPFKKLKYFREGKEQLEAYISRYPTNVEGYYVRLLIQSEVPGFLGYNSDMERDIEFVETHMEVAILPDRYKAIMQANINKITQTQ